jgi:hypothetical protein
MELPAHSLPRKAYRSDLRDAQWKRIKRLLPKPNDFGILIWVLPGFCKMRGGVSDFLLGAAALLITPSNS